MKQSILSYLAALINSLNTEIDRESNPLKVLLGRAKTEILTAVHSELQKSLPEDPKPEDKPVAVEAELVK